MRFATLSTLLLSLALGQVSAQQADPVPREPHDVRCGVPKVTNAALADCEALLNDDQVWADGDVSEFQQRDFDHGAPSKIACGPGCCVFHRWDYGSIYGDSREVWRQEAKKLLRCATAPEDVGEDDIRYVNGRGSFWDPNVPTAKDNTKHSLCITGSSDDGESCFAGYTKWEYDHPLE